jgi:Arylsulfatase A and related enzymes
VSLADVEKFGQLFTNEDLGLSYDFDATIARLHLGPAEVRTLVLALDVIYKSRVNYLDELFGGVVDKIAEAGLLDQSLIVLTSDHGEMLYRENAPLKWTHFLNSPEELRVPLVIRSPGLAPGVYPQVTRSVDVFPTMLGLSNIRLGDVLPDDEDVAGVDLSPSLRSATPGPALLAYSHTSLVPEPFFKQSAWLSIFQRLMPGIDIEGMWVAIRDGDIVYKLDRLDRREVPPEAYDWKADPGEKHNVFDAADPHHRARLADLRRYKQYLVSSYLHAVHDARGRSDSERVERLRSLGYIR